MTVFAVTPVVDYEPPRRDVPQCRPSSHAPPRRRPPAPRRACTGPTAGVAPLATVPMGQAAAFADAALRRVLEVIDRRRPAAQLRPMLAPGLMDSVLSIGRGRGGAAMLRRTRLQPSGRRRPETAAEVFGTYSRGDRTHAIACRVEQLPTGAGGARWLVVALHIG
ncbi:hypothetical protein A5787_18685 [Mycobacterium sp. 852002-50816_SCH5313054-b]|uniref:Rv3235 family protein n=1 Tax=Mycobacterium sp. 852002-50816_SCH5313054-b TaxID=1834092 RepID=UPI0007FF98E6|nr:Rv3235 family protein [Mycobacterium sp. 852002-50816_SCH5313054-b]OBF60795.1 hypothetical protein A5787_18685 [Mycobacterium sp. 852002-50816_SCH5313054-b]